MRLIAVVASCAGLAVLAMPAVSSAQSTSQSTTTTTVQTDANTMWEKMKGSWTQTKGVVKEQWGKLTDDDLLEIEGRRDRLVGKIQTRYGVPKEEAEAQVVGWEKKQKSM